MSDTSLAEAISASRKNERKKKTRLMVTGVATLLLLSPLAYAAVTNMGAQEESKASITLPTEESYKYAYLEQKCNDGLLKYSTVAEQLVTESKKLTGLMSNPTWLQNTANLVIAEGVIKSNSATMEAVKDSSDRLKSCTVAVGNKADFTDAQIADIESIITGVPQVTAQPTNVGGVSIPTFTFTPYTYKTSPSNYDAPSSSTPTSVPTTAVLGAAVTPRPTATPKVCNETQNASYKAKYDYDQNTLSRQEEAEIDSYRNGHSGMESSGLYQGAINEIHRKYTDESNNLTRNYNNQLASINCT